MRAITQTLRRPTKLFLLGVGLMGLLYTLHLYTERYLSQNQQGSLLILWLAAILLFAKLSGVVERYGHPTVLGELLVGALFGNLSLIGITFLEPAATDRTMQFLTQLGSILLLFQAGLAIDLRNVRKFFFKAVILAVLGIIFSVGTFYVILPYLIPNQSQLAYLYFSLAISTTGASVTTRVMQDLGKLKLKSSQYIISAGSIDNIICFILQAILVTYVETHSVAVDQIGIVTLKILTLIAGVLVFCTICMPFISKIFASIYPHRSLKFALAFSVGLFAGFFAQTIGISPVIGAFLAGVAIHPQYFKHFFISGKIFLIEQTYLQEKKKLPKTLSPHMERIQRARQNDLEEMFVTPSFLLVSIFFVVTGMNVDLRVLANPQYVFAAVVITILFFATKSLAAFIVERKIKSITGIGMSPRGVTTLVFASIGTRMGILEPELTTIIIFTVMLATFVTPIILTNLMKKIEVE